MITFQKSRAAVFFLIFLGNLFLHLFLMKDFSLSWDYHYHHYAGLFHLGLPVPSYNDPPPVPFSLPDSRLTIEDPFGPLTQTVPTLFQVILSDRMNIIPFDMAYNLPMVIAGSMGPAVIYLLTAAAYNPFTGFVAAMILSLNPSYFAYLHNNMKDVPNAVAFAVAVLLFYRLYMKKTYFALIAASLSFAIAFNIKINSAVIPAVCLLWLLAMEIKRISAVKGKGQILQKKLLPVYGFFIMAPVLAFLVWFPFWKDPIGKLMQLPSFYSNNTINMPVLLNGKMFYSGVNIPAYYPYLYLAITTQFPVLFLFIIGIIFSFRNIRKKGIYSLVLIWFFLPLLRYLSPKSGAIDGVRHFMEVLFPMAIISAIGFIAVLGKLRNEIRYLSLVILVILLAVPLIKYHPYQASYFNILTGGISGANGKYDIDFWGTPQREAIQYLNRHAAYGASVNVFMAQSTAAVYARDDLRAQMNVKNIEDSDYSVILNRESFLRNSGMLGFVDKKISDGKLIFTREIDGVPLVWIFKK